MILSAVVARPPVNLYAIFFLMLYIMLLSNASFWGSFHSWKEPEASRRKKDERHHTVLSEYLITEIVTNRSQTLEENVLKRPRHSMITLDHSKELALDCVDAKTTRSLKEIRMRDPGEN